METCSYISNLFDEECVRPIRLETSVRKIGSTLAKLTWSLPSDLCVSYVVLNTFDITENRGHSLTLDVDVGFTDITTVPGHEYRFDLTAFNSNTFEQFGCDAKLAFAEIPYYRAVFSLRELFLLLTRAVDLASKQNDITPMTEVAMMFRCKPKRYFDDIKENHNQIMHPYLKDNNGDAASPINGCLNGLFFSVNTESGHMPRVSPFGNLRFTIPAERIITPLCCLYFTDFYCINLPIHYVTIVACRKGTQADVFCQNNLLPLDKFNNPFLMVDADTGTTYAADGVWVEVFITEPIDIMHEINLDPRCGTSRVPTWGRGKSKVTGLPKNTECKVCNIKFPMENGDVRKYLRAKRRRKNVANKPDQENNGKFGTKDWKPLIHSNNTPTRTTRQRKRKRALEN